MDHWNKVLPGYILKVQHEELLNQPEKIIRGLLDFCNLEFEKQCLEFHKTKRLVKTASSEQVRQPLNTKGVGRWKPYKKHLMPFRDKYKV